MTQRVSGSSTMLEQDWKFEGLVKLDLGVCNPKVVRSCRMVYYSLFVNKRFGEMRSDSVEAYDIQFTQMQLHGFPSFHHPCYRTPL